MRTYKEIQTQIEGQFLGNVYLSNLDIYLPVSVENNLIKAFAAVIYLFEILFYQKEKELQSLADRSEQYVAPWYIYHNGLFQYGDTLGWDTTTLRYGYSAPNPTAKIIAYSAVTSTSEGEVIIKAAKDNSGVPEVLTSPEKTAFQGYWEKLAPVGTPVLVISEEADKLKIELSVKYDPYLPLLNVQEQVETNVKTYLKALDFGGVFRISKLIDAIQQVNGVVDAWSTLCEARPDSVPTFTNVVNEYTSYAGYLDIDALFPLSTQITYIAI